MVKIVYNINSMVIDLLSKMNSKLERRYGLVPLSFDDVALNLNSRYEE